MSCSVSHLLNSDLLIVSTAMGTFGSNSSSLSLGMIIFSEIMQINYNAGYYYKQVIRCNLTKNEKHNFQPFSPLPRRKYSNLTTWRHCLQIINISTQIMPESAINSFIFFENSIIFFTSFQSIQHLHFKHFYHYHYTM